MKKTSKILLGTMASAMMLITSNQLQAQQQTDKKVAEIKIVTPEDELEKAQMHFYYGAAVTLVGTEVLMYAAANDPDKRFWGGSWNDPQALNAVIGTVVFIGGVLLECEAFHHIYKSSKLMHQKELTFNVSPVGCGMCFKF